MNWANFILHAIDSLNGSDLIRRIGWTLIHGIWQGFTAAIGLKAALTAIRGRDARASNLCYLLACGAMLFVLGSSIVTFILSAQPGSTFGSEKNVPFASAAAPATPKATPLPIAKISAHRMPLIPMIVIAWAMGAAMLGARQVVGWVAVQRLRWSAPMRDYAWTGALSDMSRRMGIKRVVRLLGSSRVRVPVVLGTIQPAIVIPLSIVTGLSIEHIRAILAHELAHVRRHDYVVNLIQAVLETLFFHHPAVRWISGQILFAREECCDDLAIAECGSRIEYARALVALEEKCVPGRILAPAATDGSLTRRIRRLLGGSKPGGELARVRGMRGNLLAVVVVMLVILPAAQYFWHSGSQNILAAEHSTGINAQPAAPRKLLAGDEVSVSIMDLMGNGTGETVKECRITESGNISLPLAGRVAAAGMTEEELEKAIAQKYIDAKLMRNPQIAVDLLSRNTEMRTASTAPDLDSVRVTVGMDGEIAVDGGPGNWNTLHDRLAKLSLDERAKTYVALIADTGDVPVSVFFAQESAAHKLVDELKLAYVSIAGINRDEVNEPATRPARVIYISGNIRQPGAYDLGDHWRTLQQFLAIAGGVPDGQAASVNLIRRSHGAETVLLRAVPLSSLMNGDQADLYLEPGDLVIVADMAKSSPSSAKP